MTINVPLRDPPLSCFLYPDLQSVVPGKGTFALRYCFRELEQHVSSEVSASAIAVKLHSILCTGNPKFLSTIAYSHSHVYYYMYEQDEQTCNEITAAL